MLFLTPIHATTPVLVTGNFFAIGTPTVTESRTADGNTFSSATGTFSFSGGIQGVLALSESAVVTSTGNITILARGTFTGMIAGSQQGIAVILVTGRGSTVPPPGTFQGQFVLTDGSSGLSNLHGEGTVHVSGGQGTYSVQVHFDPA